MRGLFGRVELGMQRLKVWEEVQRTSKGVWHVPGVGEGVGLIVGVAVVVVEEGRKEVREEEVEV